MLNDQLLTAFMQQRYGYGTYAGKYWFVGMEERGATSLADARKRLETWQMCGGHELDNLAKYHIALGKGELFQNPPRLQKTWNKLVRILLSVDGEEPTLDDVKAYQRDWLGRFQGDTCLLELFPLPAPDTNKWPYAEWSRLPHLASREAYRKHLVEMRVEHIRRRLEEYQPEVVVFYGLGYRRWWQQIAAELIFTEEKVKGHRVLFGNGTHSIFAMIAHPVAPGVPNDYFHEVGNRITQLVGAV